MTGFLSALQSGGMNVGNAISTVVAITGCLSAIVHTVNQHLQFAPRAEKSLGLSKSYQNVADKIEAELNLMKAETAGASGASHSGLPAALSGVGGMLGKIPGFPGMGGESSGAAPASSSSGAAAGPTTATKAKFLQMIQTEIAQLNGDIDDMPAALSTAAEAAVGLAAVTTFFGCFKRHKPVSVAGEVMSGAGKELSALRLPALAEGGGSGSSSAPPSRASSRGRAPGEAPSGARQARPTTPAGGRGEERRGEEREAASPKAGRKGGLEDVV